MRVTHIITRLIVGGAQENTVASVLGLRSKPGLEVDLISGPTTGPEGSLESSFDQSPEALTIAPQLVRPVHPFKDLLALAQLTRMLRQRQPHIVHTHSSKAGVLGRLAARRARVPIVVHTIHGPSFGPFQGAAANLVFTAAERHAGRCTHHFVSVADAMTRQFLAAGIGRPDQFTRVFSGFPLDPFLNAKNDPRLRARFNLQPDDFVVGKVARLFKLKGHDDLLDAVPALVKRCPQIKFLLVGGGPWRERFEARIKASGLEKHVVFTGLVAPSEIPALVGIMDVLVHLSYREGIPRALPQALAAAKPVVAYDCDGAAEVCLENQTGFVIPPRNLNRLVDRLIELAGNPALRERLGRCGQQLVRQWFPVERMVDDLDALYRRLAKGVPDPATSSKANPESLASEKSS
jgi:glycosyltransferase involved in cell wall biosynthesis